MSKSWVIGDWAAEAERAEEEEKARAAAASTLAHEAFPTLGESLSAKPRKKKQQQHTFSISELTIGRSVSHGTRTREIGDSRGLTAQEMMMLPTGPRDRSGEQDQYTGGAFRDYRAGGDYRGGPNRLDGEQVGRNEYDRVSTGFLHDRERDRPSRADGSSNWSSSKTATSAHAEAYGERRFLPDGEKRSPQLVGPGLPPSRADGVDNWGLAKRSLPLALAETRLVRRNDVVRQPLRADEASNWTSSKKAVLPTAIDTTRVKSRADDAASWLSSKRVSMDLHAQESSAANDQVRTIQPLQQTVQDMQGRPIVLAPQSQPCSPPLLSPLVNADGSSAFHPLGPRPKPNPTGATRPHEDVPACRGPDDQNQSANKELDSRPSSRSSTSEILGEPAIKPRPKVNPFGNAKPREVLLQEQGKDWRKMDLDLEHRRVDRLETSEETALKEQIRVLTELSKQEMETSPLIPNRYRSGPSVRQDPRLHAIFEELHIKERQLQELTTTLDDNVRFSQKTIGRLGSQSGCNDIGRSSEMLERLGSCPSSRPGSRSGGSDANNNYVPTERLDPRRNFDALNRPPSFSDYGPWSRAGQILNSRESTGNQEGAERIGSWSRCQDKRGFEPSQRSDWQSAMKVISAEKYIQQACVRDTWARSDVGHHNQRTGWRGQERGHYRDLMRKF